MNDARCIRPLLLIIVALLGACASPGVGGGGGGRAGHTLIAGGGTSDDNTLIYGRFLELAGPGGKIGIIPTASGVELPGLSTAATISKHIARLGGGPREIVVIPIYKDTPEKASNPAIVEQIRSCRALWFVGGAQSRIVSVFRPGGVDTPAAAACREVLAAGGVIGGTSAGAAMMSDPMIRNGTSANAMRFGVIRDDPSDADDAKGIGIGPGMGFFPFGLTDQHFLQRGRLGRLIVALEATGQPRGFGVAEDSAIDVDLATGVAEVLGPAGLLVVDRSQATGDPARTLRQNIRVSLLSTGDRVDTRTGRVTTGRPARSPAPVEGSSAEPASIAEPWARNVVTGMIRKLADDQRQVNVARDAAHELRLMADTKTGFFADPSHPGDLTAIGVRLDLVANP